MTSEIVYTVDDYWDGPREGFAQFAGRLHHYRYVFDDKSDDWTRTYRLTPLQESLLPAVLESWEIWRRWEAAFHRAETTRETHPALPVDRQRYEELKDLIQGALAAASGRSFTAEGQFDPPADRRGERVLHVTWRVTAA
jgi:hypothetical protein